MIKNNLKIRFPSYIVHHTAYVRNITVRYTKKCINSTDF